MNGTLKSLGALVLCLAMLSGCDQKRRWTEDVQLGDGRTVRVERAHAWERTDGIGQPKAYTTRGVQLILRPESGEPHGIWSGEAEAPIVLGFDIAAQEFYIIAAARTCGFWIESGAPVPAYWEYRNRANEWVRTSLPQEHIGLPANLLIVTSLVEIPAHVSGSYREDRNHRYVIADVEFQRYSRVLPTARVPACQR